jgi:Domain of unknown function (DUF4386)
VYVVHLGLEAVYGVHDPMLGRRAGRRRHRKAGIVTSKKSLVRLAGSLYLVVAVFGGFAELVVRAGIVEPGDAAATAANIRGSTTLFRMPFVSDLVQATVFLFTAMARYPLLKHVHELVARAMVVLVAISSGRAAVVRRIPVGGGHQAAEPKALVAVAA